MNKTFILGNLGRDPEVRKTKAGDSVVSFSVATTKKFDGKENTQWHNIVCFKKTAELCEKYLTKGSKVLVEGELSYSQYENKDGVKVNKTEIIANNVQFLSTKPSGQQATQAETVYSDDQIPF